MKQVYLTFFLHFSHVWTNPVERAEKRHIIKSSANSLDNQSNSSFFSKSNELQEPELIPTCVTRECIGASFRILNHIDVNVDPCEDFYQFTCGRFLDETTIPSDKPLWSSFDAISEDIFTKGVALLESEQSPDDFGSYDLIRRHFKSCMDSDSLEGLGVQPLLDVLKNLGGWPLLEGENWDQDNFSWWTWTHKVNKIGFGIDSLITFSLSPDDKNSSWRVIGLDQATLGLSREYLIRGNEDGNVQHYYNFMVDTAIYLGASKELAKEELQESLDFEISLARISQPRENRRNATFLYNPTTIEELPVLEGLPPSWLEYIQGIFEGTNVTINNDEKVILRNFDYLTKLSDLLQATDQRVLANYLAWSVAKSAMTYLNEEGRDIAFRFDRATSGIQEKPSKWKRCVKEMGFNSPEGGGLALVAGSMYARKHFKHDAKKVMMEMTNYIRKAFKEDILKKLDWMNDKTKARALKKLEFMDQFIAYSDEILEKDKIDELHMNIEIVENDYLGNSLHLIRFWRKFFYNQLHEKINPSHWTEHSLVTVVNAFYNPGLNNFEFPAGILQGTFFNAEAPMYLNFAAIGTVIGHEITHGFDDQGKQRNEYGEIENWWDPLTERQYKEKAQCIIDQYGNYTSEQVGLNLNGINNQGENIADNGGIKESYKAYNRWVADHGEERILSGLPYTSRQLFWISFGQVWCTKFRDESLKSQILTAYHSPANFRVIGSLSNNEDFAKDFNCPVGSKMNPEQKCAVW